MYSKKVISSSGNHTHAMPQYTILICALESIGDLLSSRLVLTSYN